MKAQGLVTLVLLTATNFAMANGGLDINNVEQHMNAQNWIDTQTSQVEISTQGPIDQFDAYERSGDRNLVDTNKLKHNFDGRV